MTSFNKSQFLSQFASFRPSNEWEEKFSKSLHRQVEKLGKELSEKQVECWNKLRICCNANIATAYSGTGKISKVIIKLSRIYVR